MFGVVYRYGWFVWLGVFAFFSPAAHAQWAVVDVAAVARLVEQLNTMREHLDTARDQLGEAREQYEAMTGSRGMDGLLRDVERNYLPANWVELSAAVDGVQGAYTELARDIQSVIATNAVLSASELAVLSPGERADVEASRRAAATLQALGRQALASTSARFATIEQLIDAISEARDQKAVLDLQARIGAEATMIANEQTKLDVLRQVAQAEVDAQRQRLLERSITDIGSLRRLPPLRF